MPKISITDINDPRLSIYQEVRQTNLTRWSGKFIAEGWRVVERLMRSSVGIESILVSERRCDEMAGLFLQLDSEIPVYILDQKTAEILVGYNFHAGVLAAGIRPPQASLEDLIQGGSIPLRLVWCPGLNSPENLGTIIRLAAAFGAKGVLTGPSAPDPYSRRVVRTSMGNIFSMPIREVSDPFADVTWLKEHGGYEVYATLLSESAIPLEKVVPAKRALLIFGNEADGLPLEFQELADHAITIPISSDVDSLNVSHAASIALYHFR